MFFLRQNKIIFGEIADAFQPHFSCVCWSHCHHRYQEQIFWLGHENIPHVAVCNQTNVASFAFTRSWIYEHGFKSTNFPQACWKCSTHFYELNGSGLDECLSNSSNAWVIIHTHTHTRMRCVVSCYKPHILIAFHCCVSWNWTRPALWPVKPTNTAENSWLSEVCRLMEDVVQTWFIVESFGHTVNRTKSLYSAGSHFKGVLFLASMAAPVCLCSVQSVVHVWRMQAVEPTAMMDSCYADWCSQTKRHGNTPAKTGKELTWM